jgi:hypothetical protein
MLLLLQNGQSNTRNQKYIGKMNDTPSCRFAAIHECASLAAINTVWMNSGIQM